MSQHHVKAALSHLDAHLPAFQRTLVELSRIPSVSAEGYPPEEVRRSASGVADALRGAGVKNVEVLEIPGGHPYVYGDWLSKPRPPTILLSRHHHLHPHGRHETCPPP